ncbi:hypothetical protein [Symbiopectobacterium sp. RP]|uniref:hypothetical protein n=1 Tax=Symbiopectobacterium sp. RP TaxID=3248553 RepID=UPI003D2E309E
MRGSVVSLGCQHKIYLFNKAAGSLKGNSKDALIGAAIGGAAGCAVGMTANYYLDSLQKDYATTGDLLKAMDTDIRLCPLIA